MTHAESMVWVEYRNRHGTLDQGKRFTHGLAQLMALTVNRTGGNKGQPAQASDFLPNRELKKPLTLAEAMQALK